MRELKREKRYLYFPTEKEIKELNCLVSGARNPTKK